MFSGNLMRTAGARAWLGGLSVAIAANASAQLPATPVLQNAFANPGLAFAANFGGGGGHSFYGAAASWGPGSGRFQVSGAAGADRGNGATRGAYGGRAAMSVWSTSGGSLGVGAFAGVGGAVRTRSNNVVTNPAVTIIPVGLSVGYRRPLGTSRGLSGYVSPIYRWTRSDSVSVTTKGSMRGALGIDFAFSSSMGVTLGAEFGQKTDATGGSLIGAAFTFVPGRR